MQLHTESIVNPLEEPYADQRIVNSYHPALSGPPKDSIAPSLVRPVTVAAFVDSAKILGLPRLKLRDSNGNRYNPNKVMAFEPAALVNQQALTVSEKINSRRAFIQGYLKK